MNQGLHSSCCCSILKHVHFWLQPSVSSFVPASKPAWYMSLQVSRYMPRSMASSSEAGSWMTAADLVRLIFGSQARCRADVQQSRSHCCSLQKLHDAVLACMLFGYLPPVRLSCIRAMTHPKYHGYLPTPRLQQ